MTRILRPAIDATSDAPSHRPEGPTAIQRPKILVGEEGVPS